MTLAREGASPPLHLRILIRRFHPVVGGMERQALQLATRLVDRGIAPSVWTRRILPDSPLAERVEGIPVRRFGPAGSGRLGEYGSLPRLAWALRREAAARGDRNRRSRGGAVSGRSTGDGAAADIAASIA